MVRALSGLAFAMIDGNMPTEVPLDYALKHVNSQPLLEVAEEANLVRCQGGRFSFYHQLMQEYFTAVELNRVGLGERVRVGPSDWDEVIIALCGIAETSDAIVREVVATNPYLAARCVANGAEVSEETCRVIVSTLRRLAKDYLDKAFTKDEERARHLKDHPNMHWGSRQMMDDALDNYFGSYPEGEVSHVIQLFEDMKLYALPHLSDNLIQEISSWNAHARSKLEELDDRWRRQQSGISRPEM